MIKKRWLAASLCLLLGLALSALAAPRPVVDGAGLFTAAQEAELRTQIETFREKTDMDFAVITSSDAHEGSAAEVADALYEKGGYGLGDDASGALFYIDMYQREYYLCTTGAMIDYVTDERLESALDACAPSMGRGDYAGAAQRMLKAVQRYAEQGIPEGQYRYDVLTGRRLTARHKRLTPGETLVCALIAAAVGLIFVKSVEGRYKLKGSTYAYDFRDNSLVKLTGQTDDYLRTTTTRTRKPDPPRSGGHGGGGSHHGGSGVHMSHGGMSHGGGGRKF